MFTSIGKTLNKNFLSRAPYRSIALRTDTYSLYVINKAFKQFPASCMATRLNLELKEAIVLNHCMEAEKLAKKESRLAAIDASIPKAWSLEKKISHASLLRQYYDPRAVITAHPTEVLSDEGLEILQRLVADVMALKRYQRGSADAIDVEQRIKFGVQNFCQMPLLSSVNLTPEEEILRQNRYYLHMMASWPDFNKKVVAHFADVHQGDKAVVERLLTPANKVLYQPRSWVVADIDGNQKKSVKTMSIMVSSLQTAIIDFYLRHTQSLLDSVPQLESPLSYLQRCKAAIAAGIYFNAPSSEQAKVRFIHKLNQLLNSYSPKNSEYQSLTYLRDMVDLLGFCGNLKQYLRQSSTANEMVLDNFAAVLSTEPEIISLLTDEQGVVRPYSLCSLAEKELFHRYLRTDSKYFTLLKNATHLLAAATVRELDMLSFVSQHQENFSYILSDTKNTLSLREVSVLFSFALYRNNQLFIDQIRYTPVNLIPLCETSADLARLPEIFKDILDDPYLRAMIIKHGEFVYVPGPSDLGKESGEFAHIRLIQAENILENLLEEYKKKDPRLAKVQLRALNGSGNDSQRRISQSFSQLFATFQGADASRLTGYGAYAAYVENTAGQPSENTIRAREFNTLAQHYPEANQVLSILVEQAIDSYKAYNEHPAAKALFKHLTIPELGPWLNTSSRGESKAATPKDILKSRAIGLVNYEAMTRIHIRRIMSANGLVDLPSHLHTVFPVLYQQSTVVRELVLKVLCAIATSNMPRAWKKVQGDVPSSVQIKQWADEYQNPAIEKQHHHVLAYLEYRSHLILQTMTLFMSEAEQKYSRYHLENNPPLSKPSHVLAIEVLDIMAVANKEWEPLVQELRTEILPRYQRLEHCLDVYQQCTKPTQLMIENVVLALRGDRRIMAGPDYISEIRAVNQKMVPVFADDHAMEANSSLKMN
ncbi:MAG: hypothetical protein CK426_05760 [Legionella sp.]|nr:MAG: hypothetical protein CK423_07020 [Legionella sp.]PJD98549.1 MAG: hypothetical protein CK426_05760 [Legionella sp.]